MQHKEIPIIYKQIISRWSKNNYPFGDPAYPLSSFCMKGHKSCKSNAQRVFDSMLREAHNPIECAYGHLKAWWVILNKKIDLMLKSIPTIILACCALHNFGNKRERNKNRFWWESSPKSTSVSEKYLNSQENLYDKIYSGNTTEGIQEFVSRMH